MIVALLLLQAAGALPLAELPPQRLARGSCAMFLWDRASGRRIVMASAAPPTLTLVRNGRTVGMPGVAEPGGAEPGGAPVLGFAPRVRYRADGLAITLDVAITASEGGGAVIRDGTLTLEPAGGDTVVAPVAGLIGCQ